jgi:hypothetical protein
MSQQPPEVPRGRFFEKTYVMLSRRARIPTEVYFGGCDLPFLGKKNIFALEIKSYIIGRHCCRQPLENLSIIYYDGLTISYLS